MPLASPERCILIWVPAEPEALLFGSAAVPVTETRFFRKLPFSGVRTLESGGV